MTFSSRIYSSFLISNETSNFVQLHGDDSPSSVLRSTSARRNNRWLDLISVRTVCTVILVGNTVILYRTRRIGSEHNYTRIESIMAWKRVCANGRKTLEIYLILLPRKFNGPLEDYGKVILEEPNRQWCWHAFTMGQTTPQYTLLSSRNHAVVKIEQKKKKRHAIIQRKWAQTASNPQRNR